MNSWAADNNLDYNQAIEALARQYDGYHFHPQAEGVFNPFSLLNSLSKGELGNYWFQTGTPTFLVELLKESDYDLRTLMDGVEMDVNAFSEYRADANNPIPLIYQSGYLTIKGYDPDFRLYRLAFPNEEVRYGFLNFLAPFYTSVGNDKQALEQIDEKGYAAPYATDSRQIVRIGASFSAEKRNIDRWLMK